MTESSKLIQYDDGYLNKTPIFQFVLLSCLFALWGAAASLNDILITQFKSVFTLSDFASALVQSAFYGGYFLISIPASVVIRKTTYKLAIMIGLIFYIGGCSLFFPASMMATYTMFLVAIFSIAIGLGFLETASNTYSTMLGPRKYATLRLNISRTFQPIGSASGILFGKYLVFQEGESLASQMAQMTPDQIHLFRLQMLQHTLEPYKIMICILVAIFILFLITKYPKCKVKTVDTSKKESRDDKSYEVEIEELKQKIDCLNDIIARLEKRNERLEEDVEKYRKDYLYYFDEYSKLRDKDFNRTLEEINNLKKNSLMHNARGAGRKAKFTDDQVDEIRRLREDGNTIKEIAKRYNCSVGLIHKLINEK